MCGLSTAVNCTIVDLLRNYLLVVLSGKDDKEDCAEDGMYGLQIQEAARDQAMQALRVGR